jgi:low affinity Fe/Cu permease
MLGFELVIGGRAAKPLPARTVSVDHVGASLERLLPFSDVHRLLFFTQVAIVIFVIVGIIIAAIKL